MSYRIYSVKEIAKLEKRRFREEEGVFLVEGKKIVHEAIAAKAQIHQIVASDKFIREQKQFLEENHIDQKFITVIAEHNAQRLADTETPQGIFAVIKKPTLQLGEVLENNIIVAIDNIRDPGNLGTIMRTADWFGVKGLVVSRESVDIYNDKVIRASMGSLFHLQLFVSDSLPEDSRETKAAGFTLVVTRPETSSTFQPNKQQKVCLVLGNESLGTSEEIDQLADVTYAIPKYGQAESLNVAVSFGIILSQLKSAM